MRRFSPSTAGRQQARIRSGVSRCTRTQRPTSEQDRAIKAELDSVNVDSLEPADIDPLGRSDLEYEIEGWLGKHAVEDGWQIAPELVNAGYTAQRLATLETTVGASNVGALTAAIARSAAISFLLREVRHASRQISAIVSALKSYSYLDQAPFQTVNVSKGIDDTLLMLHDKLGRGVTVRKEYADDLPAISAYGSELNQVWTNLIDNAVDAMGGEGVLTVRTAFENGDIVVLIEDDGPGIPAEIQPRIFDSFFTTKPPGKGVGLGLTVSYSIIVDRHRGALAVNAAE